MSDVQKDDRLELRIPSDVKAAARESAKRDRRTLSQWVEMAIEEKLERDRASLEEDQKRTR